MRPALRITLFLLSLAVLLATATPARAHGGHGDHDGDAPSLSDLVRSRPRLTHERVDAHLIEAWHESHGHRRWNRGQGHWGHSWATFKVQARKLREYLLVQDVAWQRYRRVLLWRGVAQCESGGNWSIDTGNGYYGGLQFSLGTWRAYGGQGLPQHQPAWYQAAVADRVRTQSGLHHWPVCGRRYGG